VDAIRRSSREQPLEAEVSPEEWDRLFDASGHWREPPQDWPEQALESKQFLQALEKCLASLPGRTSQVFLMREHLGIATPDICKELGITATHCWVLLYRARMALRECLQMNGFGTR
jgi:RNA polymerase sigma-70 factor (ECF subfamily)